MIDRIELIKSVFGSNPKIISDSAVGKYSIHIPNTFDNKYLIIFEGERLKYFYKVNGEKLKWMVNGQVYQGSLKLNKKDLGLLESLTDKLERLLK